MTKKKKVMSKKSRRNSFGSPVADSSTSAVKVGGAAQTVLHYCCMRSLTNASPGAQALVNVVDETLQGRRQTAESHETKPMLKQTSPPTKTAPH